MMGRPKTSYSCTNVLEPLVPKLIVPGDTMSLHWYIPVIMHYPIHIGWCKMAGKSVQGHCVSRDWFFERGCGRKAQVNLRARARCSNSFGRGVQPDQWRALELSLTWGLLPTVPFKESTSGRFVWRTRGPRKFVRGHIVLGRSVTPPDLHLNFSSSKLSTVSKWYGSFPYRFGVRTNATLRIERSGNNAEWRFFLYLLDYASQ